MKLGVTGIVLSGPIGHSGHAKSVVLIKRKGGKWAGRWALPGGGVKHGETMKHAIEREFWEETGYYTRATVPSFIPVAELIRHDEHCIICCLTGKIVGGELRAGDDASAAGLFPLSRVASMKLTPVSRKFLKLASLI